MKKTLYRSNNNRVLTGVCGGVADYFDIDPTIVRLIMVVISAFTGVGIVAYIVAALIMPVEPDDDIVDVDDIN